MRRIEWERKRDEFESDPAMVGGGDTCPECDDIILFYLFFYF